MGGEEPVGFEGNLPSGSPERGGRSSVSEFSRQQRVVPSPLYIQSYHGSPKSSGSRSLCFVSKCQITKIPLSPASSLSRGGGCPLEPVAMQDGLCVPPNPLIFRLLREPVRVVAILPYWLRGPWFSWAMCLGTCRSVKIPVPTSASLSREVCALIKSNFNTFKGQKTFH